jgi:hypothetical protein
VETESLKTGLSTVDSVDHAIESFDWKCPDLSTDI